jgi:hypothetical protein
VPESGVNATGRFYTKVSHLWLHNFRYDLPLDQDPVENSEDQLDDVANESPDFSDLDEEEKN